MPPVPAVVTNPVDRVAAASAPTDAPTQKANQQPFVSPLVHQEPADAPRKPAFEEDQVEVNFHTDVFALFEQNADTRSATDTGDDLPLLHQQSSIIKDDDSENDEKPLNHNAVVL